MRPTNAARLRTSRRGAIVGRGAELTRLRSLLDRGDRPALIYVHGPGGVGKTTLLAAVEDLLAESGSGVVSIDGQELEPTAASVLRAIRLAAGAAGPEGAPQDLVPADGTLVIDRFEALAGLEGWLWRDLLPGLPSDCVLLVAGRRRPPEEWVADPAWGTLAVALPLRNLPAPEAAALLRDRGVTEEPLVEDLVLLTQGHPLALVIAADQFHQRTLPARDRGDAPLPSAGVLVHHPDADARLLGRFVDEDVEPLQRLALHVCGHARRVDRGMLREVLDLDGPGADTLLTWLRARPYAESHPDGLTLHDVVRDALDHDFRWRDRDAFADLHQRIRRVVVGRIEQGNAQESQRAANDLLFLHRGNPAAAPLYAFATLGTLSARPVGPGDRADAAAAFARGEGEARGAAATHWLTQQPGSGHLVEDPAGRLRGVLVHPRLTEPDPDDRTADPVAAYLWDEICRRRPPEPSEVVFHAALVDLGTPDRLGGFSDAVAAVSLRLWTAPRLGWVGLSSAREEVWAPIWTYIGFERLGSVALPDAVGRQVGVWARDFARSDYSTWLDGLGDRELDDDGSVPPPVAAPVALARDDFDAAVRRALKDLSRPDRLFASPLHGSRLCEPEQGATATTRDLVRAIRRAVDQLGRDPKLAVAARALDRTYLRPAATQELAAEVLGLPFSTYRRHLRLGIDRLCDVLWSWELHGPGGR